MNPKSFYLKHCIIILLCCLCSIGGWGQVNYVLNPSLEDYDTCPSGPDQIRFAKFWNCLDTVDLVGYGIPEYCNRCDLTGNVGVPVGSFYHHNTRTGNGMAMVCMYSRDSIPHFLYIRDYLQGRLNKPLSSGHNYCITFYVSAMPLLEKYAVNFIGAYLDDGHIDTTSYPGHIQSQYTPQIIDSNVEIESVKWVKIEGNFTSNGTEKFITIGNFTTNDHLSYAVINPNAQFNDSYYLVDDISVVESNYVAQAGNDTTIVHGDSLFLGEIAVPYLWYKDSAGYLVLLDSNAGGIWVRPNITTTYLVKLTLCGVVTWDSIKVTVVPVGISNVKENNSILLYPNPIENELIIQGAANTSLKVYDLVGRINYTTTINTNQQSINTSQWPQGSYILQILHANGSRTLSKLIK